MIADPQPTSPEPADDDTANVGHSATTPAEGGDDTVAPTPDSPAG